MNARESAAPLTDAVPASQVTLSTLPIDPTPTNGSFADRIRLLIQRVGSATEIARKCGFSEGVVRSWRDGNSDPSRARCVTLARTLGISLVWLVAGEGAIQPDTTGSTSDDTTVSEVSGATSRLRQGSTATASPADSRRHEAASRLLQASLALSGHRLTPAEQSTWLASLYEIVGPGGTQIDADALLAFQQHLADRLGTGDRA